MSKIPFYVVDMMKYWYIKIQQFVLTNVAVTMYIDISHKIAAIQYGKGFTLETNCKCFDLLTRSSDLSNN